MVELGGVSSFGMVTYTYHKEWRTILFEDINDLNISYDKDKTRFRNGKYDLSFKTIKVLGAQNKPIPKKDFHRHLMLYLNPWDRDKILASFIILCPKTMNPKQ